LTMVRTENLSGAVVAAGLRFRDYQVYQAPWRDAVLDRTFDGFMNVQIVKLRHQFVPSAFQVFDGFAAGDD